MKNVLLNKIRNNSAKYCVVGLGYVGLPLTLRLIKSNCNVYGYDIDKKKLNSLNKGISYISSLTNKDLNYFKQSKKKLFFNINELENMDVIFVCLPTPLKKNKSPDMSYLEKFFSNIQFINKKNKIIILESTVYPGASNDLLNKFNLKKSLEKKEFYYGYSPERENPGMKNFSYKSTPKIISGYDKNSIEIVENIYKKFVKKVVSASSISNAEATKLLENLFRSVNIGLINEFKIICEKLNLDIYEIIEKASTKNFGFMKFLPGPGLGGHCIPIDPYYLHWASKKKGYATKFIKISGDINSSIPNRIVNTVKKNIKLKNSKKQIKILIVGVAYKKNVDDDRETPAFEIIDKLRKQNYKIDYHDPFVPRIKKGRKYKDQIKLSSINLSLKNLKKYDAVLIITDHDNINFKLIKDNSKLIFDSRGVYNGYYDNKKIFCV